MARKSRSKISLRMYWSLRKSSGTMRTFTASPHRHTSSVKARTVLHPATGQEPSHPLGLAQLLCPWQFNDGTNDGVIRLLQATNYGGVLKRLIVHHRQQVRRMGCGDDLNPIALLSSFRSVPAVATVARDGYRCRSPQRSKDRPGSGPSSTASMARNRSVPSDAASADTFLPFASRKPRWTRPVGSVGNSKPTHVHRRQLAHPLDQGLLSLRVFADRLQHRRQVLAAIAQYGLTGESRLPQLMLGSRVQETHVGEDFLESFGVKLLHPRRHDVSLDLGQPWLVWPSLCVRNVVLLFRIPFLA